MLLRFLFSLDIGDLSHQFKLLCLNILDMLSKLLLNEAFFQSQVDDFDNVDGKDDHVNTNTCPNEVDQVIAIVVSIDGTWHEVCENHHRDNDK